MTSPTPGWRRTGRWAVAAPNGGEYKYLDYFASVEKLRRPVTVELWNGMTAGDLENQVGFDDRPTRWDPEPLLDACPFMVRLEA